MSPCTTTRPLELQGPLHVGRARCADGNGTLTPLFFSDNVIDIARAKAICAKCPTRPQCLAGALERQEPFGVWGGQALSLGEVVVKRPTGRPPKHARCELVVDEMGVPVDDDTRCWLARTDRVAG